MSRPRHAATQAFPALRKLQDLWNQASRLPAKLCRLAESHSHTQLKQHLHNNPQCSSGLPESSLPLYVLGKRYQLRAASDDAAAALAPLDDAEVARMLQDWLQIPWFSYRSGMPPFAGSNITTDAGWGCTLRSGQMMLARALLAHCIGNAGEDTALRAHLLGLFRDTPTSPFGLHALCTHGRAAGVTVGSWLGPHALCNALQATVAHALAPNQLHVHVVSGGGGAPTLYREDIADECRRRAQAPPAPDPPAVVLPLLHQACEPQKWTPILLLIPLTLGLGRCMNPVYSSQVSAALGLTRSCGIVGGRPGSSLFFVGCQGDAVLYLDPHEVQAHAAGDGDACEGDAETADSANDHQCSVVRHTPLSSIDPSMALGFYAGTEAAFEELCDRLQALEQSAEGAPLMTVAPRAVRTPLAMAGAAAGGSEEGVMEDEEEGAQDEWMVV